MSWIDIELDGKRQRLAAARTRDGVWIGWAGRTLYVEEEKRRATGRSSEKVHDEIRAPMTGKVVAIRVAAGEAVESGAALVVLEAMKMEYRLTAPRAGVVEKIQCVEGELVDLGKALVTLLELPATPPA
jgi:3-methylcrotonyl-CoA carboxylase alpha subunit